MHRIISYLKWLQWLLLLLISSLLFSCVYFNTFYNAKISYKKAIQYSDDPGPIMRKLLFVYIDMDDNQRSIDYSNELMDKYPYDADLYYNVGVLYQRLTLDLIKPVRELFLNTTDESSPETIREVYNSFITSRKYAYNSKDFFLQASDLELDENLSTRDAVSEMATLMDQIDDLFMPSIRETARLAGIELDKETGHICPVFFSLLLLQKQLLKSI